MLGPGNAGKLYATQNECVSDSSNSVTQQLLQLSFFMLYASFCKYNIATMVKYTSEHCT